MSRSWPFLPALLALAGCPSIQSVQTAKTVGEGNFEFAIEPGVLGAAGEGGGVVLPTFNLSARAGVSDRVDIGGRFGSSLIELHTKVMFTDPNEEGVLQAAFAPQLGGWALGGSDGLLGMAWLNLPVLLDVPVGKHAFVLGPRAHVLTVGGALTDGGASATIVSFGSSFAFAAQVGPKAKILPEFTLVVPALGAVRGGGQGASGLLGGAALFTFNLGIVLGGRGG